MLEPLDPGTAEVLRSEAIGMAMAYVDALIDSCPEERIAGVYLKGSSTRSWDTQIDYVPVLSDVDIHVRSRPGAPACTRTLAFSFGVAHSALESFHVRFPEARHIPRPQLFFLTDLEELPGYLPSPSDCVRTLFGEEYRGGDRADYAETAVSDAQRFVTDARFIVEELPDKVIDRPGNLLWRVVWRITWRVAPSGPRLLTQLGMHPYDAWRMNRSSVVKELTQRGHAMLADLYAEFYLAGWDGFRSSFTDEDAARRALMAANRLCVEGLRLVETQQQRLARERDGT